QFIPNSGPMLYKNFSPLRYTEPFYYGYFDTHQYIIMFERAEGIRFSHSPSGGGPPSATEVAWDWQFILPEFEVAREYTYRERCTREEVEREFKTWRASL